MEILRFTLSGETAFFKKPEVNTYYYFTYGNIHKVALLGMFGAILGYGGYTQKREMIKKKKELSEDFPEFYERLQNLKISIIPNAKKGLIRKKVQTFNNSVGYASKEQGGNLIVKEQWLENPSWDICILLDSKEAEAIAEALKNQQCVYSPYLGKNDHYADISDVRSCKAEQKKGKSGILNCLFPKESFELIEIDEEDEEGDPTYKYQEKLPLALNAWTNNYELQSFLFTDALVAWEDQDLYCVENQNVVFY